MPHARVRIGLLAGARVAVGEAVVDRLPTRRLAALLAYLALRPDWTLRETVAEAIWPDLPEGKGLASLRNGLSVLRRVLGDGAPAIETTRTHARLARWACECDVWEFWEALARDDASEAIRLYAGDLLPDGYDAWLEPYRDGLRDAFHAALRAEGRRSLAAGEPERALALAERWREGAPYEPEAIRLAARSLAAGGRLAAARDALARFDIQAREELGTSPLDLDAALREIESETVEARPSLPEPPAYVPLPAASDPRLPPYLSRFFGRDWERAALREWADSPSALLTVTGMGGIGKTRLAVEAARDLLAAGHEVVFVPLAGVDSRGTILAALMRAFELRETESEATEETVRSHLAGRRRPTVLVLDNLEQIVEPAATLAMELLSASPRLKILGTSRERLGIEGEDVLGLLPLPTEGDDAVRMFVDRARAARADFALTARNREDVEALCRELEGLPLALEIVAAWAGAWTVAQMRASVRDREVVSRRRGHEPRHRSLEACIDWSLDLLDPDTRGFLLLLSLFRGGWTLEAAEAVTGRADAGGMLAALVDRSLVTSEEIDGGLRFSMLESVRAHGRDRLGEEAARSAAPRFADFLLALAIVQTNPCAGAQERLNHRSLDRERENFEVVASLCEEGLVSVDAAAALAGHLQLHWTYRGQASVGIALIERIFAVPVPGGPGPNAFLAQHALSILARESGDQAKAERALAELQALAEIQTDPLVRFRAFTQTGNLFNQKGQFAEALEAHRRAGIVAEELSMPRIDAVVQCNLAESYFGLNRIDEAARHWRRAADLDEANGNLAGEAMLYLGFAESLRGDLQSGARRLALYLRNAQNLGFGRGFGRAVYYGAFPLLLAGDESGAAALAASARAFLLREQYLLEANELKCLAIVDARCRLDPPEPLPIDEAIAVALRRLAEIGGVPHPSS